MTIFHRGLSGKVVQPIGKRGENAAATFLVKNGYRILARNYSNTKGRRQGEIDIVAEKDGVLIFVEVKTRTSSDRNAPLPEESITKSKLYKMQKAASCYLRENGFGDRPHRFDAITLHADPDRNIASIRHLRDIFI